jgi:hypothetical protein
MDLYRAALFKNTKRKQMINRDLENNPLIHYDHTFFFSMAEEPDGENVIPSDLYVEIRNGSRFSAGLANKLLRHPEIEQLLIDAIVMYHNALE